MITMLAISCGLAWASPDEGAVRLIDQRLEEREVRLVAITDRSMIYEDGRGLLRREPLTEFLALLPGGSSAAPLAGMGSVTLDDGRRFVGSLRRAEDDDSIAWSHPHFGAFTLALDRLRSIRLRHDAPEEGSPTGSDDLVTLVNGDTISGFVESLAGGEDNGEVVLDVGGSARTLPIERVARIDFATPARPARGTTVWLADGSIVPVRELIVTDSGDLQLTADLARPSGSTEPSLATGGGEPAWRVVLPAADLVAVMFNEGELLALADLPVSMQAPVPPRRWTPGLDRGTAGVLGARDLALPGPMVVRWTLPDEAVRACASASLPPAMWTWGDGDLIVCEVTSTGTREVFRERLWAGRPVLRFNVALSRSLARELEIRLEPGRFGPIQDHAVLSRAFVLMERPAR